MVLSTITDDTFNSDQEALNYAAQLLADLDPGGTLPSRLRKIADNYTALLAACEDIAREYIPDTATKDWKLPDDFAEFCYHTARTALAAARQEKAP